MSKRTLILGSALVVVALFIGLMWLREPVNSTHIQPASAAAEPQLPALPEAVANLQRKIDGGDATLQFEQEKGGYLQSVLKEFGIPVSSQTLVFSKSSAQLFLIAPDAPRALYFNDTVYVGYVQGAAHLEIASMDPVAGPVFYTLDQVEDPKPKFTHQPSDCFACHDTFEADKPVSRLLMLSVLSDPKGVALNRSAVITNDRSPFNQRWGGWYVTGTHGDMLHMGNRLIRQPASALGEIRDYVKQANLKEGANITDVSDRFDPKPYLTPHSDIAALLVLGHQTHVHNLTTVAQFNLRSDTSEEALKKYLEPLLESMLFAEAVPFTSPVAGTTTFAAEFSALGPRDRQGRSLRQLDLQQRLLKYPLSYLVYSSSFDALPQPARNYLFRRFKEILSGEDRSKKFTHLSDADRKAILEILTETKTDFAAYLKAPA